MLYATMIQRLVLCLPLAACAAAVGTAHAEGLRLTPAEGQNYVETEAFAQSGHLQGIATNGADAIYWGFTSKLVKTDAAGQTLKAVSVIDHHGDLTYANEKVYVAVNDRTSTPPGEFNAANPINPARQWVYEYDADLNYIKRHAMPEAIYGAGGIGHVDGRFFVVGGLDPSENKNFVYEYDKSFTHVATHQLATGFTDRGIQTAAFADGRWWFGTYHKIAADTSSRQLFQFDKSLKTFRQYSFDASVGIAPLGDGRLLVGSNRRLEDGRNVGRVRLAIVDDESGLKVIPISRPAP